MDQTGFISRVDTALADLIWGCVKDDSAAIAMVSSLEQISFSSPKTSSPRGNKKLSIFLYNITERTSAKNILPSEADSRKITSLRTLALHYLITPISGNEKDNHTLLEKIIQTFLAKPLISIADLENNIELLMTIDSLSLNDLSRLWKALDASFRLSVSLTVSTVESQHNPKIQITDAAEASQTPALDLSHVTQLYQTVLKTFREQSADWKNRNMIVKQWVLQDFQKNSGMTVEEMQSMLNSLGDKLEHGESILQFLKPLNQLVGFYQHQLDELKGLHKISHKQTKNIETITVWIEDVRALVDALSR